MNKYKIVGVYSEYCEMSIMGISIEEGNSIKEVIDRNVKRLKRENKRNGVDDEFLGSCVIDENSGWFSNMDDGFYLVIDKGNEWYDKLNKEGDEGEWSEDVWDKWVGFCDSNW